MLRSYLNTVVGTLVLCGIVFLCTRIARANDEPDANELLRGVFVQPDSDYWLGVYCTRPSATLRMHLKLAKGEGLVVRRVLKRSPADEAGINVHDVILKLGDTEVGRVTDLIDAIDREQDRETVVTLIREGQEMTELVTPARRPEPTPAARPERETSRRDIDADEILRWMEKMADPDEIPFRFRFFHPGTVFQDEMGGTAITLPKNLKIMITREDDGPAKVIVEKDGDSWEVTTDDIATLPETILPYVERFFSRAVQKEKKKTDSVDIDPVLPDIQFEDEPLPVPSEDSTDRSSKGQISLAKQMENLKKQLRLLQKDVERLSEKN